ncbi:hypothetical protein E2C01_089108 [Portunus trituberculatus]|uniref:Uncharacterized protein n=1 Tax=Portunus trituberculatus TaxID=210409 RepID=A0A5B7JB33_PORTR|nr:hypothetical protein [Portunus trituberculatus]
MEKSMWCSGGVDYQREREREREKGGWLALVAGRSGSRGLVEARRPRHRWASDYSPPRDRPAAPRVLAGPRVKPGITQAPALFVRLSTGFTVAGGLSEAGKGFTNS